MNKIVNFIINKAQNIYSNNEQGIFSKIFGMFSKITSYVRQFFEHKNQKPNFDPKSKPDLANKVSFVVPSNEVMARRLRQICAVANPNIIKKEPSPFPTKVSWEVFRDVERATNEPFTSYEREKLIAKKILTLVEKKHPKELLDKIFDEEGFMLMEGVALIGSYLRRKKDLQGLYVCTSVEAFQTELNKISLLKEGRFAFVLPISIENREKEDKEYKGDAGHKMSVCVEKTSEGTNIAILDAMGWEIEENDYHIFAPRLIHKSAKENQYTDVEGRELFWYIINSKLYSPETTKIYFSTVERQHAGFGCETFSLRDGVSFLQERDFFNKIRSDDVLIQEKEASLHLKPITLLPPIFMRSAQSKRLIAQYSEEYPRAFPQHQEEVEVLKKILPKHDVNNQNHYIDHRSHKYHFLALTALLELDTQDVKKMIQEAGVVAPCPPIVEGQAPQTLSERALFPSCTVTITKSKL